MGAIPNLSLVIDNLFGKKERKEDKNIWAKENVKGERLIFWAEIERGSWFSFILFSCDKGEKKVDELNGYFVNYLMFI